MKAIQLLPLILPLCASQAQAQHTFQRVEREQVKRAVTDPSQPSYYPKLLARFTAFDTTLTQTDYRNLYYGFVFQPAYQGYMDHQKAAVRKQLAAHNYVRAATICDSVLATIPISLNANYLKGYALYANDKTSPQFRQYLNRYRGLRDAILSSGNGLSCETAFKTIFVDDEYEIMYQYLEVESHESQALVQTCDRFSIKPSKYFQASSLYFDTSETLLSLQNQFHGKK